MSTELLIQALISAFAGTGGAGLSMWLSKAMLIRLIRQYDLKHARHEQRLERQELRLNKIVERIAENGERQEQRFNTIAERFGQKLETITVKLAVIEANVGEVKAWSERLEETVADVKIDNHRIREEVKVAHSVIRTLRSNLSELEARKSA